MLTVQYVENGIAIVGQDCTANDFTAEIEVSNDSSWFPPVVTEYTEIIVQEVVSGTTSHRVMATSVPGPVPELTNLTPEEYTLRPGNLLEPVPMTGAVDCLLNVTGATGTKQLKFTLPASAMRYIPQLYGRKPGTNADLVSQNVLSLLSGKTPGSDTQDVFSSRTLGLTAATCAATSNANFILKNYDFSHLCFSRESNTGTAMGYGPLALVGPRHFVYAFHTIAAQGDKVVWRRSDGTFLDSVITAVEDLGNDCGVGLLDRDITGISYASFMPPGFTSRFAFAAEMSQYVSNTTKGPCVGVILSHNPSAVLTATRHAQPVGITSDGYSSGGVANTGLTAPVDSVGQWYSTPYPGDSGSPVYMLVSVGGQIQTVLLCQLYTAGGGPSYQIKRQDIEAWFSSQGQSCTLSVVSLSEYPIYS